MLVQIRDSLCYDALMVLTLTVHFFSTRASKPCFKFLVSWADRLFAPPLRTLTCFLRRYWWKARVQIWELRFFARQFVQTVRWDSYGCRNVWKA